jgi:hypothetical protein
LIPAPVVPKTYEMVANAATDVVVSWAPGGAGKSFVVWDPRVLAVGLLPASSSTPTSPPSSGSSTSTYVFPPGPSPTLLVAASCCEWCSWKLGSVISYALSQISSDSSARLLFPVARCCLIDVGHSCLKGQEIEILPK